MIKKLFSKIFGNANEKELNAFNPSVARINRLEEEFQSLSEADIKKKTGEFKDRLKKGETMDDIKEEAFAVIKNAFRRLYGKKISIGNMQLDLSMIPFDVQLLGGLVLHQGKIAEMKTGEGKTLVATMPLYLNALSGQGAWLVTVNDYLAKRDALWMGEIYKFLGLSVGIIVHEKSPEERKKAYACDIVYGTNNEFGFDYLRDNMAESLEHCVQRNLNFAIVDEVDSILIDEARTPLIISRPAEESTKKYYKYAQLIKNLEKNIHYNIDEKAKTAVLTEDGIAKMEELLNVKNIYTEAGFREVHHIEQALKSHACYKKDVDYVVKEGQVIIVDEFTGRLMPGRRYSEGLHQAIEAKEGVEVKRESRTLATITFQNFFRLFNKLSGMTGTAITEAEEFYKIYGLDTLVIPTNKPCIREDKPDIVYKNEKGKFEALVQTVKEKHKNGQPVLVGTISIEKSEVLSSMLKRNGVPHNVLNAKYHEHEAEIISRAGKKGAVTIATNMAGRGTDIKLDPEVKNLGGLAIIGSERHESRRIDNQLRGRSGRQGDKGESQFFVSMEDSLMRLFGSDRIKKMMDSLGIPDNMPIENKMVSRSIESAQKKVEGHNFDIRKHLVEYDDIMNKHREIIYARRRKILEKTVSQTSIDTNIDHKNKADDKKNSIKTEILKMIKNEVARIVSLHTNSKTHEEWNYAEIVESISAIRQSNSLTEEKLKNFHTSSDIIEFLQKYLLDEYEKKEADLPSPDILRSAELFSLLRSIDVLWMEHIDEMSYLRDSVALKGYGQRDPLIEYKAAAFDKFKKLLQDIETNTVNTIFKIQIETQEELNEAEESREKEIYPIETNADIIENELVSGKLEKTVKAGGSTIKKEHIGRNTPCPCGSGKKYKKCCGR